jgi:dUTP pyrophosphatase
MKVVRLAKDAVLPRRSNPTDSGLDVCFHSLKRVYKHIGSNSESMYEKDEDLKQFMDGSTLTIPFGFRVLLGTGLKATVGPGFEIQIRPRSGLALKQGLTILNSPATIDEMYRDEISVIVINLSRKDQTIKFGDRIAQLVVAPLSLCDVEEVTELDSNNRGGGFGHSGS